MFTLLELFSYLLKKRSITRQRNTLSNFEVLNTQAGIGITFFTEEYRADDELCFYFKGPDLIISKGTTTVFIFENAGRSESIQATEELTLIGINSKSKQIVIDIECKRVHNVCN